MRDSVQSEPSVHASAADFPIAISTLPINAPQRGIALVVLIALVAIGIGAAPFSDLPAPRIEPFIPVLQTAACLVDLIIAALLFSQYAIRPLHATLAIAAGYICSGLFAFAQTLAFPGAYSATGLIGDGQNTAAWLFILWQTAFPVAALTYALSKDRQGIAPMPGESPTPAIVATVGGAIAATVVLSYMAAILPAMLPNLYAGAVRQTGWATVANIYLWTLNGIALGVLFFRRRTILDLWLMVALLAWWPNFLTATFFTVVRFSVGWYISRSLAVVISSTLLLVLLSETTMLYVRLANSISLSRRERADRLATVEVATSAMAHEIRQPLAGIATMGVACLNWLKATPANIERARECVTAIVDSSHRAEEIISVIGGLFRIAPRQRTMLQLNDVCWEVIKLMQHDILASGLTVKVHFQGNLPLVDADHIQLQQVILNLIRNAIDAMSSCSANDRRLLLSSSFDERSVKLCVRDSGPGIADADSEHIFEPFYSTKPSGMGLGLAICRKIVEEHGGELRLAETNSDGSTFEIVLPAGERHPR